MWIRGRTRSSGVVALLGLFAVLANPKNVEAFLCSPSPSSDHRRSVFRLEMAKKLKRGRLGSIVSSSSSSPSPPARKTKKTKRSTKKNNAGGDNNAAGISPALSEWMSQREQQQEGATTTTFDAADDDAYDDDGFAATTGTAYASFEKETKSSRRTRQKARRAEEAERNARISTIVQSLMDVLPSPAPSKNDKDKKKKQSTPKKKTTIEDILVPVEKLLREEDGGAGIRPLLSGKRRHDYRLAWVGSDDAICHIGTGLHKVPLARLQELFLTFTGKQSGFEILEVIRILGPFPNVKNVLQGRGTTGKPLPASTSASAAASACCTPVRISYDSMVDGTGKEVLADKERNVDIHVLFSDEQAIVAVVPDNEQPGGLRRNPSENNGYHLLVFVREPDLEEKLESLRVA